MSSSPFDHFLNQHAESDHLRIEFLKTELTTGFTLASLAETERHIGDDEAAARCLALAETAYSMLVQFLSDPKHAMHIADAENRHLTTGTECVREKLDGLLCRKATTKSEAAVPGQASTK